MQKRLLAPSHSSDIPISGVAPGDYKLYAWEAIEPYGYFDLDFVKHDETRGQAVRVTESGKMNVTLKMIPPNAECTYSLI